MNQKEEAKISFTYQGFPSINLSNAEKADPLMGARVGNAIEFEWFRRGGHQSSCRFYTRDADFHNKRLYARAEQSQQKYKNEIAYKGDLSYTVLDWSIVPIIPKFVDIIVNGMADRVMKPKVEAVDPLSSNKKIDFRENIEEQMAGKEHLLKMQENFGVEAFTMNPDDVPETEEDLELYMNLHYKPAVEIAQEISINTILEENNIDDIKWMYDYDQTVLGVGFIYHEFRPGEGINVRHLDPATVIHSYTENPYFKDCFYWGHVEKVPLSEISKINPEIASDNAMMNDIKSYSSAWFDYHTMGPDQTDATYRENTVTLLYFSYKTTHKFKYKRKIKNGQTVKMIPKEDDWNPSADSVDEAEDFEVVEKIVEVWYDGIKVAGTKIILKWELQENMVRPESATQKAIPRYVGCAPRMYKGKIISILDRMIQFADAVQLIHLKLQQVIARTIPDGVYIDADGLNEVDLGNGGKYDPNEALNLYFQTGSVVGRSFTGDGEFNHGKIPIQELNHSSAGTKIQALITAYDKNMDMLRDVTGINKAVDASSPDERSLVGIQKMAALSSNTATRHILDAKFKMLKGVSEAISLRLNDALEYNEEFREEFTQKVGRYNKEVIESMSNMYLYSFGIHIHIAPDEEQKQRLEENIQRALDKDNIDLEDAIDIRSIENVKLATQLLKVKRKRKQQREERMAAEKDARASKMNMQQIEAAAIASMKKSESETKQKTDLIIAEGEEKRKNIDHEVRAKRDLMREEFGYSMQLRGLEVDGKNKETEKKEESKKALQEKIGSQQSEMIDQRKKGTGPINFESNEDSLDGFDLSEFDPR
jgi:hypothetical protein